MRVTSQPRLIIVILLTLIVGFFGYLIFGSLIFLNSNRSFFAEVTREFNNYDIFFTCFLIAVEIYLSWYFLWRWTIISIDGYKQQVKVLLPFRIKQKIYAFSEIKGFYLTSRHSKWCEIKILVLNISETRNIKISDLETVNFRAIEAVAWEKFQLLDYKTNLILDTAQKEHYRTVTNKNFEIAQAKSIKGAFIITLIGIIIILLRDYEFLGNNVKRQLPNIARASLFIFSFYLLYELVRIKRKLRDLLKL